MHARPAANVDAGQVKVPPAQAGGSGLGGPIGTPGQGRGLSSEREPCGLRRSGHAARPPGARLADVWGLKMAIPAAIPAYFSHNYRPEDQDLNQWFWRLFADAGFSFFVDPRSDITIHAHLERMMNRCSAFVAVANQRLDAPCSGRRSSCTNLDCL